MNVLKITALLLFTVHLAYGQDNTELQEMAEADQQARMGQQIYGTQFIADASTQGKFMRYRMDPDRVTDEERQYYGVETLAEQAEKERLMNLKRVGMFYMESKSIEKTLDLIRSEFEKGDDATYNTGEQPLNAFGYGLLNQGLDNEALAIFELNTQLYPQAFNTYDSYGEALRKVGRTDDAISAYQKSLALNPDNDNAENVLRELTPRQ